MPLTNEQIQRELRLIRNFIEKANDNFKNGAFQQANDFLTIAQQHADSLNTQLDLTLTGRVPVGGSTPRRSPLPQAGETTPAGRQYQHLRELREFFVRPGHT